MHSAAAPGINVPWVSLDFNVDGCREGQVNGEARYRMVAMLPRLRAFALSLTRSQTEADDLVQGACARALRSLSSFQEGTNFDAWLMRILRNLWIDGYRRKRDEVLVDTTDPRNDSVGVDGRDMAETRSTLAAAWRSIRSLPEEQRSVLVLVCVEGLSYRETAHALDMPIGTVMSRLARARKAITATIDADRGDTAAKPTRHVGGRP